MQKIRNLSWKQKNRLLLVGFMLGMWVIYSFAVSNTLEARASCSALQLQLDSASDAPTRIIELKNELTRLDALSGLTDSLNADSASHEQLLDLVTEYCGQNSLTLREFDAPVSYQQQQWMIETHPFTVQGNFVDIVRFLEYLQKHISGKIVSTDIHSKNDIKTKTTALLVTVYVQNILTLPT